MSISRQDSETVVHEFVGDVCEEILVLPGDHTNEAVVFFILTNKHSVRGFLDAGLLFLTEHNDSDSDSELSDEEEYYSLENAFPVKGNVIKHAYMHNAKFSITFEDESELIFKEVDDVTYFKVIKNETEKRTIKAG
ncbi:MAG: hypothetical protein AAGA50_26760 [Pseudomonadota bacterium]